MQVGEGLIQPIYVNKRPGVDIFMEKVGHLFEVVIFTASLPNYADPVIDFIDPNRIVRHRLYRDSCLFMNGLYIKDLSRLGRPLDQTLIVDNAPASYLLHQKNALGCTSWFTDPDDRELMLRIWPMLQQLAHCQSVPEWRRLQLREHSVDYED